MLIIPTVQDEVRRCARVREEYTNIEKELGEIDSSIEAAFQTAEEKKKTGYSDEVKQAIKMLSNEVGKYTVLKTFQRIFDQAVVTFEKANALKNTRGNVFRHDLYARLLFAMKFYGKAIGTIKFMCIDEGQDLAFNEYRLLYELNQYSVVFNIFGDTNQLIKKGRGISDWKDLKEAFGAQPYILNENYRNTNQITRFCNSSFGMNVMQTGVDGPNVREIARKELENELSTLNISNERIAILVPRSIQKSTWLDMTLLPRNISWIIGDKMDNGYISLMYVDEVKGIEFDKAYVVSNGMSRNEKYIAYTRALSELVLVMDAQAAG